jgi:prepilin-type N-terminal cleavage/methylation domain-containing protein/prepilin-type processing-associated H-X9-DG protein
MNSLIPRRKAFTLIELLVVIAIIAILAAILFPVFAQAKAAAKKTAAISNAKQIDLGSLMYSNDYDDTFTPYFSGYNPNQSPYYFAPSQYWPQLISTYIQKVSGSGAAVAGGANQALDTDLSGVFFDPIETFKSQKGDSGCTVGNVSSWGISDDIVNWWEPSNPVPVPATYIPVNNSQVVAPAGTLIYVETFDWLCDPGYPGSSLALSFFDDGVYVPGQTSGGWLDGAQQTLQSPYNASYIKTAFEQEPDPNGTNNVAFIDGHVKSLHTGTLTHQGNYWSIGNNDLWP